MIYLNLNRSEIGAITKLALSIADADGERHQREIDYISAVIKDLGISSEWIPSIFADALMMSPSQAKSTVSSLNSNQKKFACAFIGSVVFIDRKVLPAEMLQWSALTKDCGLPTMSLDEAYLIMNQM